MPFAIRHPGQVVPFIRLAFTNDLTLAFLPASYCERRVAAAASSQRSLGALSSAIPALPRAEGQPGSFPISGGWRETDLGRNECPVTPGNLGRPGEQPASATVGELLGGYERSIW